MVAATLICWLSLCSSNFAQPIEPIWDTIYTGPPGDPFVALAVSNFGEVGQAGKGGVNMDFTACGLECGTRHADSVCLYSASPFLLEADDSYSDITLTCSYAQASELKPYSWVPVELDWAQVQAGFRCYIENVLSHGKFVSSDGHFAAELYHVTPVYAWKAPTAVTFLTRVYAADGQSHPHVTLGWVVDWNIPSDKADSNLSSFYNWGSYLYCQGTDSADGQACLPGDARLAAAGLSAGFKGPIGQGDLCGGIQDWGTVVGLASLLDDIPDPDHVYSPRPNAVAWWDLIGSQRGLHLADSTGDLATWLTLVHDYTINAWDTIYFWTTLITVYDGDMSDLGPVSGWALLHQAIDCTYDCPWGRVGDVNGRGGENPTLGDISTLIDAKFITGTCSGVIVCLGEADINRSGDYDTTCEDITISDIAMLVDYLFITGPANMELPCCSDIP